MGGSELFLVERKNFINNKQYELGILSNKKKKHELGIRYWISSILSKLECSCNLGQPITKALNMIYLEIKVLVIT